jgi:hypothetical protein
LRVTHWLFLVEQGPDWPRRDRPAGEFSNI